MVNVSDIVVAARATVVVTVSDIVVAGRATVVVTVSLLLQAMPAILQHHAFFSDDQLVCQVEKRALQSKSSFFAVHAVLRGQVEQTGHSESTSENALRQEFGCPGNLD